MSRQALETRSVPMSPLPAPPPGPEGLHIHRGCNPEAPACAVGGPCWRRAGEVGRAGGKQVPVTVRPDRSIVGASWGLWGLLGGKSSMRRRTVPAAAGGAALFPAQAPRRWQATPESRPGTVLGSEANREVRSAGDGCCFGQDVGLTPTRLSYSTAKRYLYFREPLETQLMPSEAF